MAKVAIIDDGLNFTIDSVPLDIATNIISLSIAGRYRDNQPVATPTITAVPDKDTTTDNHLDNEDGEPP